MDVKTIRENPLAIKRIEDILHEAYSDNETFNTVFDSENIIEINSLIKDREAYNFLPSDVLFSMDRDAYFDELENWSNGKVEEENREIIDYLKEIDKINIFTDLVQSIERKRIAPFVGAGLCSSLGFPTWGTALKEIVNRLEDIDLSNALELIDSFKYLDAAEILLEQDETQFLNYITEKFSLRRDWDKENIVVSALKLLPAISSGCVITTNYDRVLEKVFEFSSKPFEGFMYGTQQQNKFVTDLIKGDRCILKLHGNVGEKESYIFSNSQYEKAYGKELDFKKPLPKALRQIFISHSLLFLGCSLEQDRTLELFKQIKDEEEFEIPDHFAFLPKPKTAKEKREKENRLLKINIKVIWYPTDEHDYVEKLLKLAIEVSNKKIRI
ncbi:SIR2 family protein [Dysgonomonas sp. 520]|uniref:SIR2 family protein n=1 Tax=Dysgonomonas sp. 520 TaxID=2302931 RepID=UPI0013D3CE76|nr:SIR2 family protein [Dysgonomonas sp. 520]NDW11161.1 hypothetical protein [Dysgonomonas sp. 520]